MRRGLFISFEGSEGCGKTTQIRRLEARLRERGTPVLVTREPGGTTIGEEIRHLLQFSSKNSEIRDETELLLFTASRAQLVREVIEPALAAGTVVIADRFHDSTTVYQGVARQLDPRSVKFINDFAVGHCRPDVTFVLDLDPAQALARVERRPAEKPDRMEQQPAEFYRAVRAGYIDLARNEPERIRVLDAAQPVKALEAEIWQMLEPKLHEDVVHAR